MPISSRLLHKTDTKRHIKQKIVLVAVQQGDRLVNIFGDVVDSFNAIKLKIPAKATILVTLDRDFIKKIREAGDPRALAQTEKQLSEIFTLFSYLVPLTR